MSRQARRSFAVLAVCLLALAPSRAAGGRQEPASSNARVAVALELWRRDEPKARVQALRRLGRLGPRAAEAVPALIAGLSDRDPKIRGGTADVLRRIGPSAAPAGPALLAALNDPDRGVRSAAAQALRDVKLDPKAAIPPLLANLRAGPDRRCPIAVYALAALGEPAVPALIDLLKHDDKAVRSMSASSLSRIGPAARSFIPALIEALRSEDRRIREDVAEALAGCGPEAVEPLSRALRDRDPKVRGGASLAIEILGDQARAAVPALIEALSDPEPPDDPKSTRGPSFKDFERQGEPFPSGYDAALCAIGSPAVPALMARLDAPDRRARSTALRALGFMGDDAKPAVPRLIEWLGRPAVRAEAAFALGGIGAREAIPKLIESLKDADAGFRAVAAETLGRIGWERHMAQYSTRTIARGAVWPLAAALKDPDSGVRAAAARALDDIGTESSAAIPELTAALVDPDADVRLAALQAFGRIGEVPAGSRDALLGLLKDPDSRVREVAPKRLGEETRRTEPAVAGLLALLKDPNADVRAASGDALIRASMARYSNDGSPVIDAPALAKNPSAPATLRAALDDPDPRVRSSAARLLPVLKGEAAPWGSLLTTRLKDSDAHVRRAAIGALRRLGLATKDAAPLLLEALSDPDEDYDGGDVVGVEAAETLEAIGPAEKAAMIDRLTALLGDSDKTLRGRARRTLEELKSRVSPALFRLLADPKASRLVKVEVLNILAGGWEVADLGPEARAAIPALRELADDEDIEARAGALSFLIALEPSGEAQARAELEAVRSGVEDQDNFRGSSASDSAAIGVFIEALKDPDEDVRTYAAYAIAGVADGLSRPEDRPEDEKMSPEETEEFARDLRLRSQLGDALVAALKDPDTEVRWAVAWALYVLGSGEGAVPALIEMSRDRTTRIADGARIRLATVLGSGNGNWCGGPSNGELMRVAAIQALGGFGIAAVPAVPALADALKDGDGLTRWYAAGVLGEIGPEAKAAVPELIGVLRSKEEVHLTPSWLSRVGARPACAAARALGLIGAEARAAVGPLAEVLADEDADLKAEAAEALGLIGPAAGPAIPALIRALRDPAGRVAGNASDALGSIGVAAVPALIEALGNHDAEFRRQAIDALGAVGPAASPALPNLVRALADSDEEIRTSAAAAIGRINGGPEAAAAAVPGLFEALKDPDRVVRQTAAKALGNVGSGDDRTVPALAATMRDGDRDVRSAARNALVEIGMPAFPTLRAMLRDDDRDLRDDAAYALSQIADPRRPRFDDETDEQAAARVKPPRDALFAALKDPDERIREGASQTLGRLGKDVAPRLIEALDDPSPMARLQAARTLKLLGDEAASALGPLRERLADPEPDVRRAAQAAIDSILKADP